MLLKLIIRYIMAKTKLQTERIDLGYGVIHNESSKLPGHEARMVAHEERIHEAIGPIISQKSRKLCSCSICHGFVRYGTVGSEH